MKELNELFQMTASKNMNVCYMLRLQGMKNEGIPIQKHAE